MSVVKHRNTHFTQVEVESSYASSTTQLSTADTTRALYTHEEPEVTLAWAFDGNIDAENQPGGSRLANIAPAWRKADYALATRLREPGSAYSSTESAPIGRLLRGHGLSATYSATSSLGAGPGWTYAPQRSGFSSIAADFYVGGECYHTYGGYISSVEVSASGAGVPEWRFTGQGIAIRPVDSATPGVGFATGEQRSYAKSVATASTNVLTITSPAAYTLKCREWTWRSERPIEERLDTASLATAHPGFMLGNETATLTCLVEAPGRYTVNPYISGVLFDPAYLYENATTLAMALTIGTVSGRNGFRIAGSTVSLTAEPKPTKVGSIACWELEFAYNASTPMSADTYSILLG